MACNDVAAKLYGGGARSNLRYLRRQGADEVPGDAVGNGGYIGGAVGSWLLFSSFWRGYAEIMFRIPNIRFNTVLVFGPGALMLVAFMIFQPSELVAKIAFGTFAVIVFIISFWKLDRDHRLTEDADQDHSPRS